MKYTLKVQTSKGVVYMESEPIDEEDLYIRYNVKKYGVTYKEFDEAQKEFRKRNH